MTVLDTLFGDKAWYLTNLDDGQTIKGQFEPEELTENLSVRYSKQTVLNRQTPIIQFLSGDVDTITFKATMFNRDALTGNVEQDLEVLKEWRKREKSKGRPPILSFRVGDSMVSMAECVIESLGGVRYSSPTLLGKLRKVELSITLLKYTSYSLEGTPPSETRYHRAAYGDYYEMLCAREYGSPILGDVIRKRHPQYPNIQTGNVIKLPSVEAIRNEQVTQTSVPLAGAYSRRSTPQRTLRKQMFDRTNAKTYTSHIMVE